MLFNSFQFLWLFPVIFIIYYSILYGNKRFVGGGKIGNYALLLTSYLLYIQWNPLWALILLYITAITFFGAFLVSEKGNKKWLAVILVIFSLFPLIIFKYYNFFNDSIKDILSTVGISVGKRPNLGPSRIWLR